jgi:hypothetical protein
VHQGEHEAPGGLPAVVVQGREDSLGTGGDGEVDAAPIAR